MPEGASHQHIAIGHSKLQIPSGKKLSVRITPLGAVRPLSQRVGGATACSASVVGGGRFSGSIARQYSSIQVAPQSSPTAPDLMQMEALLRKAALSGNSTMLLGLDALPTVEMGPDSPRLLDTQRVFQSSSGSGSLLSLAKGAGIYQLTSFPIARFNGVALPSDLRIRFADPRRWLQQGAMESRLLTIFTNGKQYYSWDAHSPVGKTPHDFYHVNQKGMYKAFGQSDHAPLTGNALIQARQLRYLKIGGRIFLITSAVVDTALMGQAAVESYQQQSFKPLAAQTVRSAGGWAAAWAGTKAGVALGGMAGVETGPGMVLTAIGGGIIGGVAGYFGANWIADLIYEH